MGVLNCFFFFLSMEVTLKVYMTDYFFYLLDRIFMLFSYGNRKTNSLSIFLPLFFGGQIRVISLPVGYKTVQDGGLGIEGL